MRETPRDVRLRVGRNIRQLRRLRGLTQERLAELAGYTNKHIGQIERGQTNFTVDLVTSVAIGLSVSVGALFESTPDKPQLTRSVSVTDRELEAVEQAAALIQRTIRLARRRD
jgi:transcriptional regulator with XRE-family HTH domain